MNNIAMDPTKLPSPVLFIFSTAVGSEIDEEIFWAPQKNVINSTFLEIQVNLTENIA